MENVWWFWNSGILCEMGDTKVLAVLSLRSLWRQGAQLPFPQRQPVVLESAPYSMLKESWRASTTPVSKRAMQAGFHGPFGI